ncbi:MAG: ribonuclease HII [Gemmatimonadota bacterium]|nr:ribonuclease HII [Gemmatimonadota bacterium]
MAAHAEETRLQDLLGYERGFWSRGLLRVAGVDEVGRGPLAGPVVAAAVVLPRDVCIDGATDSKLLTEPERDALAAEVLARALVGVGAASTREIDRLNILVATRVAMERALAHLGRSIGAAPDHVVIDGLPMKGLSCVHEAIVEGDRLVHSIACASIVAKVVRDRLMRRLHERYPDYGWITNVGYGTLEHREAIRAHGPTPHHRMTFGLLQLEFAL